MKLPENTLRDILILLLLISVGIASRFVLVDIPNFKPIASIVLFAAFWFRSYWVAGASLLLVMLVSNHGLDHCPWQVTIGVVSGLAIAALIGRRLRSQFESSAKVKSQPVKAMSRLFGGAFLMSTTFFLISNLAVWSMGQWYPLSVTGLAHCFSAAIPFFKYTLGGDLFFSLTLFATWYAIDRAMARRPEMAIS